MLGALVILGASIASACGGAERSEPTMEQASSTTAPPTASATTVTPPRSAMGPSTSSSDGPPIMPSSAVSPELPSGPAQFPLTVSDNGRYLVDRAGRPFLIQGDAAWSLLVQLDLEETDAYLDARRAQGFNTLVVNLIEHRFADDPPRNAYGEAPFLGGEAFMSPNPAYFEHAATAIEHARDRGFMVLLAPAYLGYDGGDEGWYREMLVAGSDRLREYGRFVGERFAALDNVVWMHGGDFTPPDEGLALVEAVRAGIITGGASQLETAHWGPETSGSDVGVGWLDLDTTYTYGLVHVASGRDEAKGLGIPHFLVESAYEEDIKETTPQSIRAQAYEALLTGAAGQVYGHGDIWQFRDVWPESLDTPGSRDIAHLRALFDSLPWTELVPDLDQRLIAAGGGSFGNSDHVSIAATRDRSLTVVYVPSPRTLELDLGLSTGQVTVSWYDPTAGSLAASAATAGAAGTLRLETPGKNASGDGDWVLVVQSAGLR